MWMYTTFVRSRIPRSKHMTISWLFLHIAKWPHFGGPLPHSFCLICVHISIQPDLKGPFCSSLELFLSLLSSSLLYNNLPIKFEPLSPLQTLNSASPS